MKWIHALLLLLTLSVGATAQTATPPAPAPNPAADNAADAEVRKWLGGGFKPQSTAPNPNATDPNEEVRRLVQAAIAQIQYAPVPQGARVSFNLRRVLSSEPNTRTYAYPITSQATDDAQLTVTMQLENGTWSARTITFGAQGSVLPDFINEPWAGWLFAALSAALLYACIAPTFWRKSLEHSGRVVRENAGIFIGTNLFLYGVYLVGTLIGLANPVIVQELGRFFSMVLSANGVAELTQGTVATAAFGIFLNNLRAGILFATFLPGSFFAVPAYLISMGQFLLYGVALAPVGTLPLGAWLLHVPTIIIELQAYIFVVASSGVLLKRIFRRTPFGVAWREYAACLPLAISILALGAWYEAFEILVLIPALLR
jgi:hypothetical protein